MKYTNNDVEEIMIYSMKLKPDRDISGLLPPLFCIFVSALAAVILGFEYAARVMGGIVFIYSIFTAIAFYRTKNIGYLVSTFYIFFMSLYLFTIEVNTYSRKMIVQTPESLFFFIITLFCLLLLLYMLFTKKIKWRGREILELAACNVEEDANSYTDRPRPVAKIELTRDEAENFAIYLAKNLVAFPFYEQERILFIPVRMGQEYYYLFYNNINYWDKTWVALDFDGTVSAHISKNDYLEYKKNLNFNSLTLSLGNVFIDFFEDMKKGEEIRIIDKLNEVKVGYFS